MSQAPAPESERSVLTLIRALQAGSLAAETIGVADRRRVVEHLWAEGYSAAETGEILKVHERTVLRDRAAIRQANALRPDESFIPETLGALVRQADQTISRLRRLVRDKQTPPATRVEAELGCWTVSRELVGSLQSLGYLPTAQTRLIHRLEHAPNVEELQMELKRFEAIAAHDPQSQQSLALIRDELARPAPSQEVPAGESHD